MQEDIAPNWSVRLENAGPLLVGWCEQKKYPATSADCIRTKKKEKNKGRYAPQEREEARSCVDVGCTLDRAYASRGSLYNAKKATPHRNLCTQLHSDLFLPTKYWHPNSRLDIESTY